MSCVMAVMNSCLAMDERYPGPDSATLDRRLAISLNSSPRILPIKFSIVLQHPRVQPCHHIYSHKRPYTDIRAYTSLALNQLDSFRLCNHTVHPFRGVAT